MKKVRMLKTLTTAYIMITILISCSLEQGTGSIAEENKTLLYNYIEAMNKKNEGFLDNYFAEDYIYHGPAGELDAEGFKATHKMFLSAFPDIKASIEDIIAADDKVVTRWKMSGTHQGELQGMPPSGKKVTFTGIIITKVVESKVAEEWEAFNLLSIMKQIGAIPSPPNNNE